MQEYVSRIDTKGTWHSQDNQASYQWDPEINQTMIKEMNKTQKEEEGRCRNSLDIQIIQNTKEDST